MRLRFVYWLLIAGFAWLILTQAREIEQVGQTLAAGRWPWIAAALVLQLAYYLVFTALYQTAFRTVGVRSRIRDLLPVVFASLFVNVTTPTGGTGGVAVFVDDAVRRGESAARATAGTLLAIVTDLGAFLLVLAPGLWYLWAHHDLRTYEVVGTVLLLGLTGGLVAVLMLGLRYPVVILRVLKWARRAAARIAGWLHRPAPLAESWPERTAGEFAAAGAAISSQPFSLLRPISVALAAHLLDALTLYAVIEAFQGAVSPGVVVAAYGVAVLFWIVGITPEGVGIVEGAVTVTLASLGVPAPRAAAIALAFRGLSFWLPMAVGFVLLRRMPSFRPGHRLRTEAWSVRAIALLAAGVGLIDVTLGLRPHVGERMRALIGVLPFVPRHGVHLTLVLAGFGLLSLAGNLWRRKHAAWFLALLLLAVSAVASWLHGAHRVTVFTAGIGVWIAALRPQFHAGSDPPSARQGLRVLGGAALFTLAYGVAGFYVLDRHFTVNFSLTAAVRQTFVMFTQFWDPGLEPITGFGRDFADSIYVLAAISFTYAGVMLTRPVLLRGPATSEEHARATRTVEAHGHSSLARLLLLDDKAYFFSPGGSVVAYTVVGRIGLALGDPIGPEDDAAAAVQGFAAHCRRNDWLAAFYQTLPDYLDHYRAAGLTALCVGHEAIVDLRTFTLEGGEMKTVRGAVNHLTKLGHRAVVHPPPLGDHLLDELRAVSDEWLAAMRGGEKRFSLGWFDDEYVRSGPVMTVQTPDGAIVAFANIVPEYRARESTIDLMRHRRSAPSGAMDFLFVSLFQWAKGEGYETFNLGLSPLAGIGEAAGDPAVERGLHFIYDHVNQLYNFRGLHRFKEKFRPGWSPRYLIYPGLAALPAVAVAVISADAGRRSLLDLARQALHRSAGPRPGRTAAGGA